MGMGMGMGLTGKRKIQFGAASLIEETIVPAHIVVAAEMATRSASLHQDTRDLKEILVIHGHVKFLAHLRRRRNNDRTYSWTMSHVLLTRKAFSMSPRQQH